MSKLLPTLARIPVVGRLFGTTVQATSSIVHARVNGPTIRTAAAPVLVGQNLNRWFGAGTTRTHALKDVSVSFQKGEMNLLMGPSGSGKSTLLAVLSALLRPDSGSVSALNNAIWQMGETELEDFRLKHCSYIFQGYNLFPALTARQQLEMVLRWGEGASARDARKRADMVLGQLGLTSRADLRPMALSGGEKQRVAIARALVKNHSFIFAYEPTSALDWHNGELVMYLLREQSQLRGATVLLVTHDHRLEGYADRIFQMADGTLLRDHETDLPPNREHWTDSSKDTPYPLPRVDTTRLAMKDLVNTI